MVNIDLPIDVIMTWAIVFMRVSLMIVFLPLFGDEFNPRPIKIIFGAAITMVLVFSVDVELAKLPTSLGQFIVMVIPEVLFALAIGLSARLLLESVRLAGEFTGIQMGFMTASVVDPSNNSQISLIAQFWQIASILILLSINGHHIFIMAITRSFEYVPVLQSNFNAGVFEILNIYMAKMFIVSLQLSAPIAAAMILVNICLALVNKVVPQMHVFMESFPIRLMLGFGMLVTLTGSMCLLFEGIVLQMGKQLFEVLRSVSI